jgi:hypothetical protein
MRVVVILLFYSLIAGCTSYGVLEKSPYFNLDSLLSNNLLLLTESSMNIQKTGKVNGVIEERIISPDSAEWVKEFEVFRSVNINKPGTVNAYEKSETTSTITYQLKPSEKQQGVISQMLTYDEDRKLVSFEAFFKEENSLYQSERSYLVTFNSDQTIGSYQLEGRQKVLFGEWTEYNVLGKIKEK